LLTHRLSRLNNTRTIKFCCYFGVQQPDISYGALYS
jgi:hypothetical protein